MSSYEYPDFFKKDYLEYWVKEYSMKFKRETEEEGGKWFLEVGIADKLISAEGDVVLVNHEFWNRRKGEDYPAAIKITAFDPALFTKDNILDDETDEHNYNFKVITALEKDKFKRTGPNHLVDIEIYWFDDKDMAKAKLGVMSIHKGHYSELLIPDC